MIDNIDVGLSQIADQLNRVETDKTYAPFPPPLSDVSEILGRIRGLVLSGVVLTRTEKEDLTLSTRNTYDLMMSVLCPILGEESKSKVMSILGYLPMVKEQLINDAIAIYRGDPAANSISEIIACYPGFFAVTVYRIAHLFYNEAIPFISRMMSEIAHIHTGIDIHPGAKIGEKLCIDHGTGVVIGETAVIGDRVKIYQGVTIGAKSFESDDNGKLIKGKKRHPNIGSDCVIYAGATILGGKTVVGDGCVIGGNVWLTHSVPPGTTVLYNEK